MINLSLTVDEYNLMYKALGKLTIEEGLPLLQKVSVQATQQAKENNAKVEDPLTKEK